MTLTCVVQSLAISAVNWTTDANVTLPSTSIVSNNDNSIHNSTLILEQVTLDNMGEYFCNAINDGGKTSAALNVTVYGKEI